MADEKSLEITKTLIIWNRNFTTLMGHCGLDQIKTVKRRLKNQKTKIVSVSFIYERLSKDKKQRCCLHTAVWHVSSYKMANLHKICLRHPRFQKVCSSVSILNNFCIL